MVDNFMLTDIQKAYFLEEFDRTQLNHACITVAIKISEINVENLEKAILATINNHDILRAIIVDENRGGILPKYEQYYINKLQIAGESEFDAVFNKIHNSKIDIKNELFFSFNLIECLDVYFLVFNCSLFFLDHENIEKFIHEISLRYNGQYQVNCHEQILKSDEVSNKNLSVTPVNDFAKDFPYWQNLLVDREIKSIPIKVHAEIRDPVFNGLKTLIDCVTWGKLLSKAQRFSPNEICLGLYALTLMKWAGSDDFIINLAAAKQDNKQVGLSNYCSPIPVLIERQITINHFLREVKKNLKNSLKHSNTFCLAITELLAKQSLAKPFFPCLFTPLFDLCDTYGLDTLMQRSELIKTQSFTANVWLDFQAYKSSDGGVVIKWDYLAQLFNREMIVSMQQYFCDLIHHLAENDWDDETLLCDVMEDRADQLILACPTSDLAVNVDCNNAISQENSSLMLHSHDDELVNAQPHDEYIYIAPQTALEKQLCEIFSDVLDVEQVGINDDLFKLCNNSLLALELAHQINNELDIDLNITDLFENHIISSLVLYIENNLLGTTVMKIDVVKLDQYPLSYAQERLFFIEQYEGGTYAYNEPILFELPSTINIVALKKTVQAIIKRHEALRSTVVANSDGTYSQQIHTDELAINEYHFMPTTDALTESHLWQQMQDDAKQLFDLFNAYPLRVSLYHWVSTANSECNKIYMLLNLHHIALDGWSLDILIDELNIYYDYFIGKSSQLVLASLPIQYKDFAYWQRNYLSGAILAKQLSYWQNYLASYQPLALATDKSRPPKIDYSGETQHFSLDEILSTKLREIAQKHQCTLYTVLLSGFAILLSKYSNQDDIVIGTPVANRHYPQITNLVGCFVNSLAIRIHVNHKVTISDLIKSVHQTVIGAQKHQDLPFEMLVKHLAIEKDISRHPIFQVMFAVQSFGNAKKNDQLFAPLIRNDEFHHVAKFDLKCILDDSAAAICGTFNYATALFHPSTIERMMKHYRHILAQMTTAENMLLKDYSLLTQEEYQTIVYDWNNTLHHYPKDKTIQQLFEEQVARTPDNIALVFEDVRYSYHELNVKANQLANYILVNHKVAPEDKIALLLNRNQDIIIAIIATLKLGACYIPIDPNIPSARLQTILRNSEPVLSLVHQQALNKSAKQLNCAAIALDSAEVSRELNLSSSVNPVVSCKVNNLAYIIYTSGSTGEPKGVMIEHQQVVNTIYALAHIYYLNKPLRLTAFASYNFDAAVFELWATLFFGNQLFLLSENARNDMILLSNYLQDNQINIIPYLPPKLLNVLPRIKYPFLSKVYCGGETYSTEVIEKWLNNCEIYNMYGATEAAVMSTQYQIKANIVNRQLIGKPLAGNQVYVLNQDQQPQPVGVIGELYIAGDSVGRGYLNNPPLTAEKFIINPFYDTKLGNSRMYATGDLVRWLADGNLEYIGRVDTQVKIRGYRIELTEIESYLVRYPAITQAVAVVKEFGSVSNHKQLVAYYVAENELNEREIRGYLADNLPDYMLPSYIVRIATIPLKSASGKVDESLLPLPTIADVINKEIAKNNLEQLICEAYAEVLELPVEQIGLDEDFFALGGDSILTISLVFKLQANFMITVRDIFELRTPRKIASKGVFIHAYLHNHLQSLKQFYQAEHLSKLDTAIQATTSVSLSCAAAINFQLASKAMQTVLLTGATGYLGCHILYELLHTTDYTVYLPIRAVANYAAFERLQRSFQTYFKTDIADYASRIEIFCADLAQDKCGLDTNAYELLAKKVDSIIHTAALIKHYGNYQEFYHNNVQATINLLELCKLTRQKDFHYISTYSILTGGYVAGQANYIFYEDSDVTILQDIDNYYNKTKYLGECEVINYRNLGIKSNIYRIGNLAINSATYCLPANHSENSFIYGMRTLLSLGKAGEELTQFEISPVDITAAGIVRLFAQANLTNQIFHVFNPNKYNLSPIFSEQFGIQVLSMDEFIDSIMAMLHSAHDKSSVIERFLLHRGWLETFQRQHTTIVVDSQKTQAILTKLGVFWVNDYSLIKNLFKQIKGFYNDATL